MPVKPEVALEAAVRFSAFTVIAVDVPLVLSAIRRSQANALSFLDSLIIAAALAGGAARLLSEDLQDGRIIDGMRIENPFSDQV
jgi:predicted nucleic acid-binding protein